MIGITGYMSGGKTYTAVKMMLEYLRKNHIVVSNVKLNCKGTTDYLLLPCVIWKQYYFLLGEEAGRVPYHFLLVEDYENYPIGSPRGSATYEKDMVYIFLDEVSSIFDSMAASNSGGIQAVSTWARHSEKRGQRLYLIMQFASELHKRLRNHITEYIHCTNSSNLRIPWFGTRLPFFMQGRLIIHHLMADAETAVGPAEWYSYEPLIYHCYNTGQIVVGRSQGVLFPVHVQADKTIFAWRELARWQILIVLLEAVLSVILVFLLS